MTASKLELRQAVSGHESAAEGWQIRLFDEALADLKRMRGLFGWQNVRLVTENPYALPQPVKTGLALLLMSRGQAELVSRNGQTRRKVTPITLLLDAVRGLRDRPQLEAAIRDLHAWLDTEPQRAEVFGPGEGSPLYLRTNLWFGAKVGGSYSHSTGIINAIHDHYGSIDFISTDDVPGLRAGIVRKAIELQRIGGWTTGDGTYLTANEGLLREAKRLAGPQKPAFIYQRTSLGDLTGLRLSREWKRPFVAEYNGPEVWVANKWGAGIQHSSTFERIEQELLRRADIVLAVSQPLCDDAVRRGADPARVILSPNAADPERFHPDIDGASMREKYQLNGKVAALLLSSFGPWHGVEVTLHAYSQMLQRRPDLREKVVVILAGHGAGFRSARELAAHLGLEENNDVVFTSTVAASDAPALLSASDLFLSPQVANPDGTIFFGSPTKLFEYMASGRPIIASDLAQIGDILTNGETAILTTPGNIETFSFALEHGFENPEQMKRMAIAARQLLIAKHTWARRIEELDQALREIGAFSK